MRKMMPCFSSIVLVALPLLAGMASASDQTKDEERLRNAGTVLKEILDVPDSIPQDLLDKADCVVVFPSVLKAAFIVGGSYGRGAMSCRKGEIFSYSRARGLFAGISLEGSTIRPDNGDNRRVYGKEIPARDIVLAGAVPAPPAAEELISTLDAKTPKHRP